jgi:hypothetical protein
MKGIIFNLLEQVITQHHGEDVWDQLLDDAGVDGAFTSLGNYSDETLRSLVGAASRRLAIPPQEVIRWFGRKAISTLATRYPVFFERHTATRSFLLSLNGMIHPEVRKIYPGADAPDFDFADSTPETLVMSYRSRRQLCALAIGLIEGSADHFRENAVVQHDTCMLTGHDRCIFRIQFPAAAVGA